MESAIERNSLTPGEVSFLEAVANRPRLAFFGLFMIFVLSFGASIFLLPRRYGRLITGDGIYYYVWLRSAVIDGDLDFTNDYSLYQAYNNEDPVKKQQMLDLPKTATGKAPNYFSVGPALLWAPILIPTHLLSLALGLPHEGFSVLYEAPVLFLSMFYGLLGILLVHRVAAGMFSGWAAFIGVLGMWLATGVVYYLGISPSYSHVLSLFAVALFLFVWWRTRGRRTMFDWFLLGLSAGLVALVRWQDSLVTLLPLFELISQLWEDLKSLSPLAAIRRPSISGIVFALGIALAFSPQMLAWQIVYGTPLTVPQGASFFYPLHPEIANVLFGLKRGLFTWTPLVLLAVLGFIPLYRRDRLLGTSAIVIFLAEAYVNSIVHDWWGGEAFGARRFVSLIPFFVIGLAAFVESIASRFSQRMVFTALGAFVVWNLLFVLQYDLWLHGIGNISADPTLKEITVDKFIAPFELIARIK